jgi:FAD/FMN-containing dehydrogenase
VFRRIAQNEYADLFGAARLTLGALGVVSHVELECNLAQPLRVRHFKSALEDTLARLPELRQMAVHLSFEWFPGTGATRIHTATPTEATPRSSTLLSQAREWWMTNAGHWALAQTAQQLPRFTQGAQQLAMAALPESEQIEASPLPATRPWVRHQELLEMQIAAEDLPDALAQLEHLLAALDLRGYAAIECGFIAADDVWLSPAFGRDTAYVRLRQYRGSANTALSSAFMDVLDRYEARPHWGSPHGKSESELSLLYPRWNEFLVIRKQCDPRGVFLNDYLARLFDVRLP